MSERLTDAEFRRRGRKIHSVKSDYSRAVYTNSKTPVIIGCPVHGWFEQKPGVHLAGHGCPKCGVVKACLNHSQLCAKTFAQRGRKVYGGKYDYSRAVYTNSETPVIIGCPVHGWFKQKPCVHLAGHGCPKCGRIRAHESTRLNVKTFKRRGHKVHNHKYDYSRVTYINNVTPVIIGCPVHGWFKQRPAAHLCGSGCPKCGRTRTTKSARLNVTAFKRRGHKVHNHKYDYSRVVYTNNRTPVTIGCPAHGWFEQKPGEHLAGHGCPKCGVVKRNFKRSQLCAKTFKRRGHKVHNHKYDYSRVVYTNNRTPVTIGCPVHGWFEQKPGNHLAGRGCSKCAHHISRSGSNFLTHMRIPNDKRHREVKVDAGQNVRRVDGMSPSTRTVYEFLGDYWHGNPIWYAKLGRARNLGLKRFHQTQQRFRLIRRAGYTIKYIWESDWKAYERTGCTGKLPVRIFAGRLEY